MGWKSTRELVAYGTLVLQPLLFCRISTVVNSDHFQVTCRIKPVSLLLPVYVGILLIPVEVFCFDEMFALHTKRFPSLS